MIVLTIDKLWLEEFRATRKLAWPLILTNLSMTLIAATDVVMIGWLGTTSLASAALGSNLAFAATIFCMGLLTATTPLMASERGRKTHSVRDLRRTFRQGLWVSVAVSIPIWLVLWQTDLILLWLGQDADLAELAATYVRAYMWTILPYLLVLLIRNFLSVLEQPLWSLIIGVLGIFVNAGCNYVLMFGKFGIPALELVGAGIGSLLASLFMFSAMAIVLNVHPKFRRYSLFGRWWHSDWGRFRKLWTYGIPIGIGMTLEHAVFIAAVLMMGQFGSDALAAHAIAMQIGMVAFMVPLGLAQAATVRIGVGFGRRDIDLIRKAGWMAFALSVTFMSFMTILIWSQRELLVSIFIDLKLPANAEVARLAISFLGIAALIQVLDGVQVACTGMLRGLHDTRWPMIFAVCGYAVMGIGMSACLAFQLGWQGLGIWVGLALGIATVAVLVLWRWILRGKLGLMLT